jgi:hypothetical protein
MRAGKPHCWVALISCHFSELSADDGMIWFTERLRGQILQALLYPALTHTLLALVTLFSYSLSLRRLIPSLAAGARKCLCPS